jgi:uncharacterized phage protein (TIGR01671 family)
MSVNNREIKFRVWDVATKEFIQDKKMCCLLSNGWLYFIDSSGQARVPRRSITCIENYIVQFFTGLKDKNNKEIYEGDILLETMTEEMAANGSGCSLDEVRFNSGAFLLDCEPLYNYLSSAKPDILEDFRVIGNIFENPELIK